MTDNNQIEPGVKYIAKQAADSMYSSYLMSIKDELKFLGYGYFRRRNILKIFKHFCADISLYLASGCGTHHDFIEEQNEAAEQEPYIRRSEYFLLVEVYSSLYYRNVNLVNTMYGVRDVPEGWSEIPFNAIYKEERDNREVLKTLLEQNCCNYKEATEILAKHSICVSEFTFEFLKSAWIEEGAIVPS